MISILFLLLSGTCSAIASILLKNASSGEGAAALASSFAIDRPMLLRISALGAYGIGFLMYALALRRVELHIAYPLMVAITVIELFVFNAWGGGLPPLKAASGAALLVLGVCLLYSSQTTHA
ncbi:hypothetical protein [Paraburkholderia caballeronis]|uniref:Small multidrug resistance pump n=1 Tax=Paraburkholderia caballeronis TaxID=416943 RepID=A0A1H7JXQ9_9BURK|nr:hypothetical protein [Paraburkholderia caballeronis]PXW27220.1 hypothetical protein C7403_103126 [Paraburkholderia caballeronis]PXX02694.1 hypothetical protein C7407_103126 [Paraburkholderia caballeronis]RAK03419.1 hypothetical protein C7409_103126 [Paraburkholderia caballeronis]TDV17082.1 hypothetical protein C7406_1062 [Paraburkholderia caballeronis]TDV17467.1 hypothetical protein C7408_104123 [Paraburkholderia caballeronis]